MVLVHLSRLRLARIDEFNGPLRFVLPNLPKYFTVSPTVLEPDQIQALITVTAPPDAPLGFLPITLIGVGTIHNRRVERKAEPDPIFLTVMEAPQFVLEVAEVGLSIVQSREAPLHITANRKQGFIGPIELSVVGLPENSEASEATLAEGETEATITVKAGSFFRRELFSVLPPAGTQHIAVTGSAIINNEPVVQTTPALPLTIIEAFPSWSPLHRSDKASFYPLLHRFRNHLKGVIHPASSPQRACLKPVIPSRRIRRRR